MTPIAFIKFSGSGNDFICLDGLDGRYDTLLESGGGGRLARALCPRGHAVGADGVVFAVPADLQPDVPVLARFFEPDGSEAELCGNGAACFVRWMLDDHPSARGQTELKMLTTAGVIRGKLVDAPYVRVCIPLPEGARRDLELDLPGRRWRCDLLVTGVPHAITYVDDIEAVDVGRWGPLIRRHEIFAPRGANANFVQVLEPGLLAVRTFEFGVEAETLACGTGSAAAAVLAATRFGWPKEYVTGESPVLIRTRGGDTLRVYVSLDAHGQVDDLCLELAVRRVFTGVLSAELAERTMA